MKVPYGYLDREFKDVDLNSLLYPILSKGDFTLGEATRTFERELAEFTGAKFAIGVANGTDALEMSLHWVAQQNPSKVEVIVPANTFIASVSAIVRENLKPVFCDIGDDYVIDLREAEKLITNKTLAILPVHFQGQPCQIDELCEMAYISGIHVIEDAAQALDATVKGKHCGTWGDFGCISFHPQKNLNCFGDGGAILTSDVRAYKYLKKYRNHGMSSRDTYDFFSRNSRLDSVHAAYLSSKLKTLHDTNNRRIEIAEQYDQAFEVLPNFRIPVRDRSKRHTFHLYMISVPGRDTLLEYLNYNGVEARVHYPIPLHLQKCSQSLGYKEGDFENAEIHATSMISLPIHQFMTNTEVDYVIKCVKKFYGF